MLERARIAASDETSKKSKFEKQSLPLMNADERELGKAASAWLLAFS
jgi:hypothetical protein